METQDLTVTEFFRLPKILTKIPVSRSLWWAKVKSGEYPQPVKLSARVTAWKRSDIEQLCARLSGEVAK